MDLKLSVEHLESQLFGIQVVVDNSNKDIAYIKNENKTLRESLFAEQTKNAKLQEKLNDLEQYGRRNSVRIFGIRDTNSNEPISATESLVLRFFNDKLKVKVAAWEVQIAHRLGRYSPDGN